jgi:hypothetical protein
MTYKSKHGGRRPGAGRKIKWSFDEVIKIGQACEKLWRSAQEAALNKAKAELTSEKSELSYFWNQAAKIPIEQRNSNLNNTDSEVYLSDIVAEIEMLNSINQTSNSENRIFDIPIKPPLGTRIKIIEKVSATFRIKPKQADNIWQKYRRIERKLRNEELEF